MKTVPVIRVTAAIPVLKPNKQTWVRLSQKYGEKYCGKGVRGVVKAAFDIYIKYISGCVTFSLPRFVKLYNSNCYMFHNIFLSSSYQAGAAKGEEVGENRPNGLGPDGTQVNTDAVVSE